MLFNRKIVATAGALAIAGGLAFATAGPAMAAGCSNGSGCANVSAPVAQSITLTGVKDVTFPNTNPGQTAFIDPTQPGSGYAEQFNVSSNDLSGYTLTGQAGTDSFVDGGSSTIPDSNWSIKEFGVLAGTSWTPTTAGFQLNKTTGPTSANGDNYAEGWFLAIPNGTPAGSYANTLTYLAVGN